MCWIAPSEKDTANGTLEKRLWDSADQFRANSGLKAQEYSGPILGLIFLRFGSLMADRQPSNNDLPLGQPLSASLARCRFRMSIVASDSTPHSNLLRTEPWSSPRAKLDHCTGSAR